jgi:hypothetical protein
MATKRNAPKNPRPKPIVKKPKRLHPVGIRLDDAMLQELREVAAVADRPLANLIVAALREWLASRRAK